MRWVLLVLGCVATLGCLRESAPPGPGDDDDVVGPTETRVRVQSYPPGTSYTSTPVGIDCPAGACEAVFERGTTATIIGDRGNRCQELAWSGDASCAPGHLCLLDLNQPTLDVRVDMDPGAGVRWARVMGGAGGDENRAITRVGSQVVITGHFNGSGNFGLPLQGNTGSDDVYLAAFEARTGVPAWVLPLGGTDVDEGFGLGADSNGFLTVAGSFGGTVSFGGTQENADGPSDYYLLRVQPPAAGETTPTLVSYVVNGGAGTDTLRGLAVAPNGRVFAAGISNDVSDIDPTGSGALNDPDEDTGTTDFFLVGHNSALGNAVWAKGGYGDGGGGGPTNDEAWAVGVGGDGDPVLTAFFQGNPDFGLGQALNLQGLRDFAVVKFNGTGGDPIWQQDSNGGDEYSHGIAVARTTNEIFVVGRYLASFGITGGGTDIQKTTANATDGYLVKLDSDGNPVWAAFFLGGGDQIVYGVDATDDGQVVVTGSFEGTMNVEVNGVVLDSATSGGGADIFVARFDGAGALQWLRAFGSAADDAGFSTVVEPDGSGVWVGGHVGGDVPALGVCSFTGFGNEDVFLAELDP